ncbi:hypothetical protein ACHWQZ_G016090 [Mnemiopsis leidyi]
MSGVFYICRIFCLRTRRQSENDEDNAEASTDEKDDVDAATELLKCSDEMGGGGAQQDSCVSEVESEIESNASLDLDTCSSLTNVAVSKEKLMELVGDTSTIDRWSVPYSINRREANRKRLKAASLPDHFGRKDSVYSNLSLNAKSTGSFRVVDVDGPGQTIKNKKKNKCMITTLMSSLGLWLCCPRKRRKSGGSTCSSGHKNEDGVIVDDQTGYGATDVQPLELYPVDEIDGISLSSDTSLRKGNTAGIQNVDDASQSGSADIAEDDATSSNNVILKEADPDLEAISEDEQLPEIVHEGTSANGLRATDSIRSKKSNDSGVASLEGAMYCWMMGSKVDSFLLSKGQIARKHLLLCLSTPPRTQEP